MISEIGSKLCFLDTQKLFPKIMEKKLVKNIETNFFLSSNKLMWGEEYRIITSFKIERCIKKHTL